MSRISYVNGAYMPHAYAHVPIEDRGYQFSDGIYEVVAYYNQRMLDAAPHLDRMERSLSELNIPMPMARRAFELVLQELMRRNRRRNGLLYIQITRGVAAKRDHAMSGDMMPMVTLSVLPAKIPPAWMREDGCKVVTAPDQRWTRCDIKSISLLANILAKKVSANAGVRETWQLLEDGTVTEGSLSNSYIVKDGVIRTHPTTHAILGGVTRSVTLELARNAGIAVDETPFTLEDIKTADEAFLTSATSNVLPVVQVDDMVVGSGKPGAVTQQLMTLFDAHIAEQVGEIHA